MSTVMGKLGLVVTTNSNRLGATPHPLLGEERESKLGGASTFGFQMIPRVTGPPSWESRESGTPGRAEERGCWAGRAGSRVFLRERLTCLRDTWWVHGGAV